MLRVSAEHWKELAGPFWRYSQGTSLLHPTEGRDLFNYLGGASTQLPLGDGQGVLVTAIPRGHRKIGLLYVLDHGQQGLDLTLELGFELAHEMVPTLRIEKIRHTNGPDGEYRLDIPHRRNEFLGQIDSSQFGRVLTSFAYINKDRRNPFNSYMGLDAAQRML